MNTKREKDGLIDILKDRIRELELDLKSRVFPNTFPEKAITLIKVDNCFKIIELEFDPESGLARVIKTHDQLKFHFAVQLIKDKLFEICEKARLK